MASRILFNNGEEIDLALSGAYPNIITRGSGFVRDTGVQNISGVKYFYDRITFYSGINVTGDFSILGGVVGDFYPKTDNLYDLGTSALEWKNLYVDGTGRIDSLFIDENATIATGLSVGGNTIISGNLTTTGDFLPLNVAINLLPKTDNLYDLGSTTQEFRNLYVDGTGKIDSLEIDENAVIATGLSVGGNVVVTGNSTTVSHSTASSFMSSGSGAFGRLFVSGTGIPATRTSDGVYGEIIVGSGHLYACTGTNLWGRIALTGWNP